MSETNKEITLPFISEAEIAELSVTALSDRPNERSGQYGRKGLTPAELKAAFSALPKAIALRLNEVMGVIKSLFTSIKASAVGMPEYDETDGTLTFRSLDEGDEKQIPAVSVSQMNECVAASAEETRDYVDTTAANAIRANVSGPALVLDDVSSLNPDIVIETSPQISSLNLFTRNIANPFATTAYSTTAQPGSVRTDGTYEGGEITGHVLIWEKGTFYLKIPVYIPEGCTVSFGLDWEAGGDDKISKIVFTEQAVSNVVYTSNNMQGTFKASKNIHNMLIYKETPGEPLRKPISIYHPYVSLTSSTEYKPFAYFDPVPLSDGRYEGLIEGNFDNLTLVPPEGSGKVTVSARYTRDSTLVINKLEKQIAALQTAIAT